MTHVLLLDMDECLAPSNNVVGNGMLNIYKDMDAAHHGTITKSFLELKEALNSYAVKVPKTLKNITTGFIWSRELWLKHVSDKNGLGLDDKAIMKLIDAYWDAVALASQAYDDSLNFLKLQNKKMLFIITGSDRRLIMTNNEIKYDPKFSEKKKIKRIHKQGVKSFFPTSHIITGDPYDKPSTEFWERVMKHVGIKNKSYGIVVDDSMSIVLDAVKFGFSGYVLDRRGLYKKQDVKHKVTGYLTKLNDLHL